jgi:serine/threonine protein kinase
MICCLNPNCTVENSPQPPEAQCCTCGTKLVRLVGHYIPVSRLGKGAYGVTYKAEDTHKSNDNCAIKQLIVHNEKAKESFKKESEQLKKLNSKRCSGIPQMFGYFEQDGYLYLAQEFIDGKNLTTYLKEKGTLDEAQIRELLNQLLPVLKILHEHEEVIIHRDIKPENIMRRKNGEYVLIDFGISKQLTGYPIPTPDTNVGTLGYAPKEQIGGHNTYPSSDLYSLGVVCYSLLTGKDPSEAFHHSGYSWTAHWARCLSKPINNNLLKIIDKLLKENYLDRYQTAEDVLKDLNPLPETEGLTKEDEYNRDTAILTQAGAKWGFIGNVMAVIAASIGLGVVLIGLNTSRSPTAIDYYKEGQDQDGRDSKKLIEAYTKEIELNRNYADAYIGRGMAERDFGNNDNAIKDFGKAIQLNPKSSISYVYRGIIWQDLNEATKAKSDFFKVFEIKPNDAMDYHARGLALTNSGDNKAAIKAYDKAINLNPKFRRSYINRGISKQSLGLHDDAISDFDETIRLNASSTSAYFNRGNSKFALQDSSGAIKDYDKAIEIKSDSYQAYYQRGIAYEKLNDNQKAISDYTQSAQIAKKKSDEKASKKASDKLIKLRINIF